MRPIFAHMFENSHLIKRMSTLYVVQALVDLSIYRQKTPNREDSELFFVCTPISYCALQRSILGLTPYTTPPRSIIA